MILGKVWLLFESIGPNFSSALITKQGLLGPLKVNVLTIGL